MGNIQPPYQNTLSLAQFADRYPFGLRTAPLPQFVLDRVYEPHLQPGEFVSKLYKFKKLEHPYLMAFRAVERKFDFCTSCQAQILYQFTEDSYPMDIQNLKSLAAQLLDLSLYLDQRGLQAIWKVRNLGFKNSTLKYCLRLNQVFQGRKQQNFLRHKVTDLIEKIIEAKQLSERPRTSSDISRKDSLQNMHTASSF